MFKSIEDKILDISNNYYKYLMSLQNVVGVGVGHKRINKINTKETCIHVLVEDKIDSKFIISNNIIPKRYMGLKTDVIKIGKIKVKNNKANVKGELLNKIRPLEGGYGISANKEHGTLGCIVTKTTYDEVEYFILSNNHVIAGENDTPIGTPIIQPSIGANGTINDKIAILEQFIRLKYTTAESKPINYADCAIGRIFKKELISNKIALIGNVKGVNKAIVDEEIKKVGATTGLTEGKVDTIGTSINVDFKNRVFFKNQIMANIENDDGDSGSLVLNSENEAIGLLFAGTDNQNAIINDIKIVLTLLKVKMYY